MKFLKMYFKIKLIIIQMVKQKVIIKRRLIQ